jgi:hypothetical protein
MQTARLDRLIMVIILILARALIWHRAGLRPDLSFGVGGRTGFFVL